MSAVREPLIAAPQPTPERPIVAGRGSVLRAKSWRTEALLRMLENVLEVGENPRNLVVYAALGKAARDWASYERIRTALLELRDDETLMIQSGKPIGVFQTHTGAPRVLLANSNLVGRWATTEHFYELYGKGKIAWGGLTAGCWQYIGFQGVLQGTFETFGALARAEFGADDLRGRLVVTAGLGGMGSAQPLALTMLHAVSITAEVSAARAQMRLEAGLVQRVTQDVDEAIRVALEAKNGGQGSSIAWVGNAVTLLGTLVARGITPDVTTDMTSAHDALHGYQPHTLSLEEAAALRESDPDALARASRDSMVQHVKHLLELRNRGSVVFDYGNNLRSQARDHGFADGFQIKVFTEAYLRDLFARGIGPFRWVALSGDPADIHWTDALLERLFPDAANIQRWIQAARAFVPFQGLAARTAWLGHGQRTKVALEINAAVARGDLSAPVAFSRDHLDAGSMAHPNIMTENLKDGTDAVADWPILNALLLTSSGADLVAVHSGGGGYAGYMTSAGVTTVADGSAAAAARLERVMNNDTGLGVLRYADAGYEGALETARGAGLRAVGLEVDADNARRQQ
jgi:urocanate hydratase